MTFIIWHPVTFVPAPRLYSEVCNAVVVIRGAQSREGGTQREKSDRTLQEERIDCMDQRADNFSGHFPSSLMKDLPRCSTIGTRLVSN